MQILRVPPHPILLEWRNSLLADGNRAKAVKVQRIMDKMKYINTENGKYVDEYGHYT